MAMGARMKVARRSPERNDSLISGKPLNFTGWKSPSPSISLVMKSVTGQVRWQVTGRKPIFIFFSFSLANQVETGAQFKRTWAAVMADTQVKAVMMRALRRVI